jgi:hypothetical protein
MIRTIRKLLPLQEPLTRHARAGIIRPLLGDYIYDRTCGVPPPLSRCWYSLRLPELRRWRSHHEQALLALVVIRSVDHVVVQCLFLPVRGKRGDPGLVHPRILDRNFGVGHDRARDIGHCADCVGCRYLG